MRCLWHPRPQGCGEPCLPWAVRAAASGAGECGDRGGRPRAQPDHCREGDGVRRGCLHRGAAEEVAGETAIGHVRYSTAGGSMLCNAQPIVASTNKGPIAVAHNGNLVNGNELRARLGDEGAIFNSISDTEVVVHLIARSKEK